MLTRAELRSLAQNLCDMEDAETLDPTQRFVTDERWNSFLNAAGEQAHSLLTQAFKDYALSEFDFTMAPDPQTGVYAQKWALPADFSKLRGVDVQWTGSPTGWLTLKSIPFANRNEVWYAIAPTWINPTSVRYSLLNNDLWFWPNPRSSLTFRVFYTPQYANLTDDAQTLPANMQAWAEYVCIGAALRSSQKEESTEQVSILMKQKEEWEHRIVEQSNIRDPGEPSRVSQTRTWGSTPWGNRGFGSGWGR